LTPAKACFDPTILDEVNVFPTIFVSRAQVRESELSWVAGFVAVASRQQSVVVWNCFQVVVHSKIFEVAVLLVVCHFECSGQAYGIVKIASGETGH
jgi:hypothetical protein